MFQRLLVVVMIMMNTKTLGNVIVEVVSQIAQTMRVVLQQVNVYTTTYVTAMQLRQMLIMTG